MFPSVMLEILIKYIETFTSFYSEIIIWPPTIFDQKVDLLTHERREFFAIPYDVVIEKSVS